MEMDINEQQRIVSGQFNNRGVWYIAPLAILLNSVQAGILLSQLLYWHDKAYKNDFWVYKTVEELYRETGLKRSGQETAIKLLQAYGILEYKLARIPATRHFRLDIDQLHYLLDSLPESSKLDSRSCSNPIAETAQSITENTNKITQENTTKSKLAELNHSEGNWFDIPP